MALSKISRLSGPEITKVIKRGRVFDSEFFRIKFLLAHKGQPISKFAIVIGSKILKKAAERNRIKRRLSEIVRLLANKIRPGLFVILIKPSAPGKRFSRLRDDLGRAFQKINQ